MGSKSPKNPQKTNKTSVDKRAVCLANISQNIEFMAAHTNISEYLSTMGLLFNTLKYKEGLEYIKSEQEKRANDGHTQSFLRESFSQASTKPIPSRVFTDIARLMDQLSTCSDDVITLIDTELQFQLNEYFKNQEGNGNNNSAINLSLALYPTLRHENH